MGINLGQTSMKAVYLGQTAVKSVFFGNNQVWGGEEPVPVGDWLCFTAEQANSTVHLDKNGSPGTIYLETSTNGSTWTDYSWTDNAGDTLTLTNVGDKVYMRAKTENQTIGSSDSKYYQFVMTGKIAASGNIQSLLKADCSRTDAPAHCYQYMFENCTSLTAVPVLPATTLANSCYRGMFQNCTALTTAPALPATTLTSNCYRKMFQDCSSLSSVEVAFTAWGQSYETDNWLSGVAATGTFTCPAALQDIRDVSYIPVGWTVAHPAVAALRFDILADDTTIDLVDDSGTLEPPDLEFSVDDGATWTQWVPGTDYPHEMAGAVVYVRAGATGNTGFGTGSEDPYWHFTSDDLFSVRGNIMYLLSRDGSTGVSNYCFFGLFQGCTMLVDASGLELPAMTLANSCYQSMFNGCSSLTTAPELPATTLANGCYRIMFRNCSSLSAAPELSATTLATYCYQQMFQNCTSLSTAQTALPATTLSSWCYTSMFAGCSSLTDAPKLSATTLTQNCYNGMFNGCTSLSSMEVAFTAWNPANATTNWVRNVAASGTFTCPGELPHQVGASNIPVGWTVVRPELDWLRFDILADDTTIDLVAEGEGGLKAPDLEFSVDDGATWTQWVPGTDYPHEMAGAVVYVRAGATGNTGFADETDSSTYWHFTSDDLFSVRGNIMSLLSRNGSTRLSEYCFYRLFDGCTMLVDAGDLELPATTLASDCYSFMFSDCTSLTYAPKLPATTLALRCYSYMFNNTALTSAPALPATTLAPACYSSMFENCTSLTSTPALPATTLANGCYFQMFNNCTSLTAAPELPATILAVDCYANMFYGCSSLITAPELPATTLANGCYSGMFANCSSLSSVEVAFTAWSNGTTDYWLELVAASGTFTCPSILPDTRGDSNIPTGWTKVDAA